MLRYKSLYALLERRFKPVSFLGLIQDHPMSCHFAKIVFENLELYEGLEAMIEKKDIIDDMLAIFIMDNGMPAIISRHQDFYTKEEYESISEVTGIPMSEFEEIIEATK